MVVEGEPEDIAAKINILYDDYGSQGKKVAIMATKEMAGYYGTRDLAIVGSRQDLATIAATLFQLLRRFDAQGVDIILAEGVEMVGLGLAVMNRLQTQVIT